MRKVASVIVVLGVMLLTWFLLGVWVKGGSERFYLLVPPMAIALNVILAPQGWRGLKQHWQAAVFYIVILTIACTLYNWFMVRVMLPPDPNDKLAGISILELVTAVYFLLAVRLMLVLPLAGLSWILRWVLDRRFARPATASAPPSPWVERRAAIASFVAVILLVPYLLSILYVHRLKIPNPPPNRDLAQRGLEEVSCVTTDHYTIRGWFIPSAKGPSGRTVLICHGLGANRTNFLPFIAVGDELDANILIFDFRGHGDSDGHTVSFGWWEKHDVLAAVQYLRTQRPGQAHELIGLGISMGSSALIAAASELEPPLNALIIDSGFTSGVELTDGLLDIVPAFIRPLLVYPGIPLASLHAGCWLPAVRPIDRIDHLRAPVLFIHAKGDRMIPVDHSHRLHERAAEPKALWIADTGDHTSAITARTEYLARVRRLVDGPR